MSSFFWRTLGAQAAGLVLVLVGCAPAATTKPTVVPPFPTHDFDRILGGDAVEVTLLLPAGVESHSHEAAARALNYAAAAARFEIKTMVYGGHFAFGYLAHPCGLELWRP